MLIPEPLRKGDKVAIISLSNGILGEPYCAHTKETGLERLRRFGLEPVFTENALKGSEYLLAHPDFRGRGLATKCLEFARDIAVSENCYKIMLLTGSKEQSTLNLYEHAGYNSNDKTAFIQWL